MRVLGSERTTAQRTLGEHAEACVTRCVLLPSLGYRGLLWFHHLIVAHTGTKDADSGTLPPGTAN